MEKCRTRNRCWTAEIRPPKKLRKQVNGADVDLFVGYYISQVVFFLPLSLVSENHKGYNGYILFIYRVYLCCVPSYGTCLIGLSFNISIDKRSCVCSTELRRVRFFLFIVFVNIYCIDSLDYGQTFWVFFGCYTNTQLVIGR